MRGFLRSSALPLFVGGAIIATLGVLIGLGGFTFTYARGFSYLSSDPEACVNCHIMRDQFDAWSHSSHREVATCADCHMPHDFVGKWLTKAVNGFNHGLAFTTGNYPETIQIKDHNAAIAQENCIACHQNFVDRAIGGHGDPTRACVSCHGNVGHQSRLTQ